MFSGRLAHLLHCWYLQLSCQYSFHFDFCFCLFNLLERDDEDEFYTQSLCSKYTLQLVFLFENVHRLKFWQGEGINLTCL